MRHPNSFSFATLLTVLLLLSLYNTAPVQATHLGDQFVPAGPFVDRLFFKLFASEFPEFEALRRGELDVTDWVLSKTLATQAPPDGFVGAPNIHMTPEVTEFGMFLLDFNNNGGTAINFWGLIDPQFGNNVAGMHFRQAVAHLLDKDNYIATDDIISGFAKRIEWPGSPAQADPQPDFHQFDLIASHGAASITPFNLASDGTGFAEPGSADFCAARDHLVATGIWVDANNDCVIDNPPATKAVFVIRSDHLPRKRYGEELAKRIEQLFGADVFEEQFKTITQVTHQVFSTKTLNDWGIYTSGWGLTAEWDQAYDLYHSAFASNRCGAVAPSTFANNYIFVCNDGDDDPLTPGVQIDPTENDMDALAEKVKFAASLADSKNALTAWVAQYMKVLPSIPVYTASARLAYLDDPNPATPGGKWEGIINAAGVGPPNPYTWYNAYSTESNTLRVGMRQGTLQLSPLFATTVWEAMVTNPLYSTLVDRNPYNPAQLIASAANSWKEGITAAELGYLPPSGTQFSIRFFLRTDLFFHDGRQVTSGDVKFTLDEFKRIPADFFVPSTINIVGVNAPNAFTVDVHFRNKSPFHILAAGNIIPIMPKHIWDANNDGLWDAAKAEIEFDPMREFALIGSGNFVCRSVEQATLGRVGGRCSSTFNQATDAGDSFTLDRYKRTDPLDRRKQYVRSAANFKTWDRFDINNDFIVDFTETSQADFCFEKLVAAFPACAPWDFDNDGIAMEPVDDSDFRLRGIGPSTPHDTNIFGTTWIYPQSTWSELQTTPPGAKDFPPALPSISE